MGVWATLSTGAALTTPKKSPYGRYSGNNQHGNAIKIAFCCKVLAAVATPISSL
jgi:hypothetical protein